VGLTAGLEAVVKRKIPSSLRESNPDHPVVQPVASCYTDKEQVLHKTDINLLQYPFIIGLKILGTDRRHIEAAEMIPEGYHGHTSDHIRN
jgi:hypothetical protein